MKRLYVHGGTTLTSDGPRDGPLTITIRGGRIAAIEPGVASTADEMVDLRGGWLVPGLIDVQVNGGGGLLFNDDPQPATVAMIAAAHARLGVTGLMPTLISDDIEAIAAALDAVDVAIEAGHETVLGIHIEGPFISRNRRGIHPPEFIRALDDEALELLCHPRRGKVMVTLAPEGCASGQIEALARSGIIVSLGHSAATAAQAQAALAAGARGFTHLYNAMSPLHHRAPGMVGAALADRESWCGIIVDGVHVDPLPLQLALRLKGADRLMLVSDAMPVVGTDMQSFTLNGRNIAVDADGLRSADGTLAGAHLHLAKALRNCVSMLDVDVPTAVSMAAASPAAFLGLERDRGSIAPGKRADFVRLKPDLLVDRVWIAGQPQAGGE